VLKVGFLERDFERDHLAEKSNRTKMGQKIHCALVALFKLMPKLQSSTPSFGKTLLRSGCKKFGRPLSNGP
jgi:hypothetical protein